MEKAIKILLRMKEIKEIEYIDKYLSDSVKLEYEELAQKLNKIINISGINCEKMDPRFLWDISLYFNNILKVKEGKIRLSDIQVMDDDFQKALPYSQRVKALLGEIEYKNTNHRHSNYNNQTNTDRLNECLKYIKDKGYPYEDDYIFIDGYRNAILDGWHRASVLFYLYGNIEIPVKYIFFSQSEKDFTSYFFPTNRVKKGSRVAIYGAGNVGKKYYSYIKNNSDNYSISHWYDRNYIKIGTINNVRIEDYYFSSNNDYDYIIIANENWDIKHKINQDLKSIGVDKKKIIL